MKDEYILPTDQQGQEQPTQQEAEEPVLYEVISHIQGGKNSTVRLYADRLEWKRDRGVSTGKLVAGALTLGASLAVTGVRGRKDGYEVLYLDQITNVGSASDGLLFYAVTASTAGGDVVFRVNRDKGREFQEAILKAKREFMQCSQNVTVVQQASAAPSEPDVLDQLKKLGELKDAGILSEEEFAAKKAELLSRM